MTPSPLKSPDTGIPPFMPNNSRRAASALRPVVRPANVHSRIFHAGLPRQFFSLGSRQLDQIRRIVRTARLSGVDHAQMPTVVENLARAGVDWRRLETPAAAGSPAGAGNTGRTCSPACQSDRQSEAAGRGINHCVCTTLKLLLVEVWPGVITICRIASCGTGTVEAGQHRRVGLRVRADHDAAGRARPS